MIRPGIWYNPGISSWQVKRCLLLSSSLHDTANIQVRFWHHYKAKGTQSVKQRPHICLPYHKCLLSDLHFCCAVNCCHATWCFMAVPFTAMKSGDGACCECLTCCCAIWSAIIVPCELWLEAIKQWERERERQRERERERERERATDLEKKFEYKHGNR